MSRALYRGEHSHCFPLCRLTTLDTKVSEDSTKGTDHQQHVYINWKKVDADSQSTWKLKSTVHDSIPLQIGDGSPQSWRGLRR